MRLTIMPASLDELGRTYSHLHAHAVMQRLQVGRCHCFCVSEHMLQKTDFPRTYLIAFLVYMPASIRSKALRTHHCD